MSIEPALLIGIPGGWEWMIILVLVLIFFGNRIPGLARSLGGGITEFKKGLKDGDARPGDAKPGDTDGKGPDGGA